MTAVVGPKKADSCCHKSRAPSVYRSGGEVEVFSQPPLFTSFTCVFSGKYRAADEEKISPPPYLTCESFPHAVDHILQNLL